MPEEKSNKGVVVWSIIVLVLVVAVYGLFKYVKKEAPASQNPIALPIAPNATPPVGQTTTVTPPPSMPLSVYKDGIYNAVGNYVSPGGAEEIGLKVTLKDDVVVSAEMEVKATRPTSVKMQTAVKENFSPLVIGKKIVEIKLDKVSGSSLTPKGFNDAIEKIKTQAKV